jgi:hypothetical protein
MTFLQDWRKNLSATKFFWRQHSWTATNGWAKSTISNGLTVTNPKCTQTFSIDETISCPLIFIPDNYQYCSTFATPTTSCLAGAEHDGAIWTFYTVAIMPMMAREQLNDY